MPAQAVEEARKLSTLSISAEMPDRRCSKRKLTAGGPRAPTYYDVLDVPLVLVEKAIA